MHSNRKNINYYLIPQTMHKGKEAGIKYRTTKKTITALENSVLYQEFTLGKTTVKCTKDTPKISSSYMGQKELRKIVSWDIEVREGFLINRTK